MLNISFVLFCWILPSIPSPPGALAPLWFCLSLSKMATRWMRPITFQEIELLSFLKQNVIRKICEVAKFAKNPPNCVPNGFCVLQFGSYQAPSL